MRKCDIEKKMISIGLVTLFFTILLCGCTEEDVMYSVNPRHKREVTVIASATVKRYNSSTYDSLPVDNATVTFTISKTNGKTFSFSEKTDETGFTDCSMVGYNLYEGQTVTVKYSTGGVTHTDTLTFQTVYDEDVPGQPYTWLPSAVLTI